MTHRILSAFVGAAVVLGLTTGCQAQAPDIAAEQAKAFQSRVLTVSSSVADGGYAAALEELTALQTELDAAAADGAISFARHQRIAAAIAVVRADLQAAIDAQAPPAPVETVTPVAPPEPVVPAPEEDNDTETKDEKKAREAAEKAAEKAAEEAKKAAEEAAKQAEEERKKAEKDAEDEGDD